MSLSRNGNNEIIYGYLASGNYFELLGVKAALGRTFTPEDDRTPGAHPVAIARHFDRRDGVLGVERRVHRILSGCERGHHSVAQPLDDPSAMIEHGCFQRVADRPQQLERRRVPRFKGPCGEADEVREQQRELAVAAPAAGHLRQRLPQLQPGEPELLGDAVSLGLQRRDPAGDHLHRGHAGGRQGVSEPLVTRKALSESLGEREQAWLGVQADCLRAPPVHAPPLFGCHGPRG